jgi:uncharacterized protein (DUF433 family)
METEGFLNMPNPLDRISINPAVCGGKPCIKGTRIWVSLILGLLASGMSEAELLAEYPGLAHDDILAAIAYGAEAASDRIIPVPVEPAE